MVSICFYHRLLTNFKCSYFCKVFSKRLQFMLAFCISVLLGYVFTSAFVNLIVCINGSILKRNTTWFDSIVAYHNVKEPLDPSTYLKEPFIENELEKERSKNVRVLCWIMTCPDNHESKAYHVKETWGRRCNILLFMSTDKDAGLDTIKLNVSEGRDTLWGKTRQAFDFIYKNYFNEADWFMKADDDTYIIMENLRYMLAGYNSSEPVYFGSKFRPFVKQGYMSGGAGYILSKEALKRVVTKGFTDKKGCKQSESGPEDVEIGVCLENVGVRAMDTRDCFGRSRFFPYLPDYHFVPGHLFFYHWYWIYGYYPQGSECCSNTAISFHYASGDMMSLMERILYEDLRPYGIDHITNWLPQQISEENGNTSLDQALGTVTENTISHAASVIDGFL